MITGNANVMYQPASPAPAVMSQAECQRIPKEYVRMARQRYQEKIEQERKSKSFWDKLFCM